MYNLNIDLPQIRDFHIYLTNDQIINEPIENINELSEIIRIYGREIIVKIVFNFHNNYQNNHNIVLRCLPEYNDKFIIEFFYTELYKQLCDFNALMNCINNDNLILYDLLGKWIINPFIIN